MSANQLHLPATFTPDPAPDAEPRCSDYWAALSTLSHGAVAIMKVLKDKRLRQPAAKLAAIEEIVRAHQMEMYRDTLL